MDYKVRFVNAARHYLAHKDEYLGVIDDVLSRGDLIIRRDVEEFEKAIASMVGTRYAIGLNSGTDTLFFALKGLGIGSGDEVITVSHTFVSPISVIVHCGATPVLVEVGEDFLMDPDALEKAIGEKTKAIIPVHLNGRVCNMDKIMRIAEKHNLSVIEDAAQALGAKFRGKMAGSFGIAGSFSLYPFKVLGCFGDGGIVVTDDEGLAEKVRLMRDHGQKTKTELVLYGWNSRLDNLQAAVLNVKLKYLQGWIDRRRTIAAMYDKGLLDVSGITLPPQLNGDHFDTYQNYVLRAAQRDALVEYLKEKGVETLVKDPIATHKHPKLGLAHHSLPYTEQLANEVVSLPMYPELQNEQVQYVIEQVRNFYQA
ncbi:MAG: DegT/DnrJ/EryC1/StrS family aminotransferase [Patescibacteria group bacterium]